MTQISGELLLTERVDLAGPSQKRHWASRVGWLSFDLSIFAALILFLG